MGVVSGAINSKCQCCCQVAAFRRTFSARSPEIVTGVSRGQWREFLAITGIDREGKQNMKWRKVWLVVAVTIFVAAALIWWLRSKPPARVIHLGTVTLPKPVLDFVVSKQADQQAVIFVTGDERSWQAMIKDGKLVCKPLNFQPKSSSQEVHSGFFDIDKDGYAEFFKVEHDDPVVLWVFKRRESVRGRITEHQPLPSWFNSPDHSRWVVWTKIKWKSQSEYDGYNATFTFVTDPDSKQTRKVVVWVEQHCAAAIGSLFVLRPNEQRLVPFEPEGIIAYSVGETKDIDGDGICEIVALGSPRGGHLSDCIFKWDGRTYRLWWLSPQEDEDVLWARLCDFDGDGIEEGIAVLSSKKDKRRRILVVYRLESGHYRKVAQCTLPMELREEYPKSLGILPTKRGGVIVLAREKQILFYLYKHRELRRLSMIGFESVHPFDSHAVIGSDSQVVDIFLQAGIRWRPELMCKLLDKLVPFLPSPIQDWAWTASSVRDRSKIFALSFDGKRLNVRQVWRGSLKEVGKISNKAWAVISSELSRKKNLYRYRLLFGANGRYRAIWQSDFPESYTYAADLDGDSNDEIIFVTGRKVRVFKVVPN